MLTYIVYKKSELECVRVEGLTVVSVESEEELDRLPADEVLFLGTRKKTMQILREKGIAALACRTPGWQQEDLSGEPIVVECDSEEAELDQMFLRRRYEREHGIPWTILETDRCVVRELALSDLPALFRLYEQPHVTDYTEPLYDWEEEREYQKQYIRNVYEFYEFGMWLVFSKDNCELIGRAGLEMKSYPGEEAQMQVELGYVIDPKYQRRGIAAEVCRAILAYADEELRMKAVNCLIEPQNRASSALVHKLGFQYLGKMHMEGKNFDRYIFPLEDCIPKDFDL